MEEVVLKASHRDVIGKQVKALRRAGRLPAVLYGRNIQPIPISLDMKAASRIFPYITSSQLVVVDLDGEQHRALVREKQRHPVFGTLLHIDLNVVSMTEKLRANIVLELVGEAPAVKDFNAVLVQTIEELEVQCLPQYLMDRIEVDLASLKQFGDAIHVREINLSAEIEVLTDPNEVVVVATAPAVEEVVEVVEVEEAAAEPEVIERGKKEEEEEFS
jgi:large subunit ribosomal protein L25